MSAVFDFMDGKFKLKELQILSDLNGKSFNDLEPSLQAKIEDYQILSYIIQPPTPERVKFDIFDRVNRGGTPLNNHEMRFALYQGNATNFLQEVEKSQEFLDTLGKVVPTKRMKHYYLLLRALAFYRQYSQQTEIKYKGDIDDFLGRQMDELNTLKKYEIENYSQIAINTLKRVKILYPKDTSSVFRFPPNKKHVQKRPVNIALFESLFFFIVSLEKPFLEEPLIEQARVCIVKIKEELDQDKYLKIIDSINTAESRFSVVQNNLNELLTKKEIVKWQ